MPAATRRSPARRWPSGALAAAMALAASGARAQEAPAQRVSAVVVVRDAQSQRTAPQTGELVELFQETGIVSPADLEAWDKLAGALNLDRATAVDQLLGKRFVLLIGERGGGPLRWTAMSDVTRETGRRLLEKLRPAPRGSKDGRPVWTLENGKFELCRAPSQDNLQTLTLNPAGAALDAEVAEGLAGTDLGAGVRAEIWARVYLNAAPAKGVAADASRGCLEFSANRTKRGWDLLLTAPPSLLGIRGTEIPEAIAGDPTEVGRSADVLIRAEGWATTAVELPADHPAVLYFSQFAVLGVPLPEHANLGPRFSYVLERTGAGGKTEISMTAAIEVKDLSKAAMQGDAMVAGFLNLPTRVNAITKALQTIPDKFIKAFDKGRKDEPKAQPGPDIPIIQHAGEDPSAVRVATLKPANATEKGKPAVLAWVYLPHHGGGGEGGWWVIHMETGPDAASRAEQALRDTARDLDSRRARFPALLLELRPLALHELLSSDGIKWEGWVGAMRHIDYAKLDLWRGPDGRVQGHGVLDMVIPGQAASAPAGEQANKTAPAKDASPK